MLVPFGSAVLNVPLEFVYEYSGYSIHIAHHKIGEYKFHLSVAIDIQEIEEELNSFLNDHPEFITFYREASADGSNSIMIPNSDSVIANHIEKWCRHWNIPIIDLSHIQEIVDKFGNDTEKINLMRSNMRWSADMNHKFESSYTTGSINYTDAFTSTTATSMSTMNHPSVNQFNLTAMINTASSIRIADWKSPQYVEDNLSSPLETKFTLVQFSSMRNKLIPLMTMRYINPEFKYLLSDVLALNKAEYSFFIKCIDHIFNAPYMEELDSKKWLDLGTLHKRHLAEVERDNPYMYRFLSSRMQVIADIIKLIPKFIADYPFTMDCVIPPISARPQTAFQWMMTNIWAKDKIDIGEHLKQLDLSFMKNERENTKLLLPAIHASDKAMGMYLKYKGMLDENGNYNKASSLAGGLAYGLNHRYNNEREYPEPDNSPFGNTVPIHGMNEMELKRECDQLLKFIEDGKKLYDDYPEEVEIEDYGTVKMSSMKGTLLKQVRNSIFNHRMESKIGLEYKLQQLRKNTAEENNAMPCEIELPEELEELRIKGKDELILTGNVLKHCIGSYTSSKDLFFRKDTVCAQVKISTLAVTQCYDKNNKQTEDSIHFREWLETRILLMIANEHADAITERIGINEFEDHLDEVRTCIDELGLRPVENEVMRDIEAIHGEGIVNRVINRAVEYNAGIGANVEVNNNEVVIGQENQIVAINGDIHIADNMGNEG